MVDTVADTAEAMFRSIKVATMATGTEVAAITSGRADKADTAGLMAAMEMAALLLPAPLSAPSLAGTVATDILAPIIGDMGVIIAPTTRRAAITRQDIIAVIPGVTTAIPTGGIIPDKATSLTAARGATRSTGSANGTGVRRK